MNQAGCKKCGVPLYKPARGPVPTYCSVGCRRAAELELRRIQQSLQELEAELSRCRTDVTGLRYWPSLRTGPERIPDLEAAIAQQEARLRVLLDDGSVPTGRKA